MNHNAFNSAYNITQYKISLAFKFNKPLLKKHSLYKVILKYEYLL